MSCCVVARHHLGHVAGTQGGPIMGTWDYKWPLGSKVRVAFQRPKACKPSDFKKAKATIIELAKGWHDKRAAIEFDFSAPDFEPPDDGRTPEPQRRSDISGTTWRSYDVLVSLEQLPVTIDDPITIDPPPQTVFLPFAQLGTYARRVDFGTPTMFVGPIHEVASLAEHYATDPVARTMVVHEFGHALGLAHEHQSPKFRAALQLTADSYDIKKIDRLLKENLGIPEETLRDAEEGGFFQSHLQQVWPGNERFSDWRQYVKGSQSVMSVPYHDCSLKPAVAKKLGLHQCPRNGPCTHYEASLFDKPTASDLAFLRAMYPVS